MRVLSLLALLVAAPLAHGESSSLAAPATSGSQPIAAACAIHVYENYGRVAENWQHRLRDTIVEHRADLNEIAGLNQRAEELQQQRRLARMKYLLASDAKRLPVDGGVVGLAAFAWSDSDEQRLRTIDYEYASLAQQADDADRQRREHPKRVALGEFLDHSYGDRGPPGVAEFAQGVQDLDGEWNRCGAAPARPSSRIE